MPKKRTIEEAAIIILRKNRKPLGLRDLTKPLGLLDIGLLAFFRAAALLACAVTEPSNKHPSIDMKESREFLCLGLADRALAVDHF